MKDGLWSTRGNRVVQKSHRSQFSLCSLHFVLQSSTSLTTLHLSAAFATGFRHGGSLAV